MDAVVKRAVVRQRRHRDPPDDEPRAELRPPHQRRPSGHAVRQEGEGAARDNRRERERFCRSSMAREAADARWAVLAGSAVVAVGGGLQTCPGAARSPSPSRCSTTARLSPPGTSHLAGARRPWSSGALICRSPGRPASVTSTTALIARHGPRKPSSDYGSGAVLCTCLAAPGPGGIPVRAVDAAAPVGTGRNRHAGAGARGRRVDRGAAATRDRQEAGWEDAGQCRAARGWHAQCRGRGERGCSARRGRRQRPARLVVGGPGGGAHRRGGGGTRRLVRCSRQRAEEPSGSASATSNPASFFGAIVQ